MSLWKVHCPIVSLYVCIQKYCLWLIMAHIHYYQSCLKFCKSYILNSIYSCSNMIYLQYYFKESCRALYFAKLFRIFHFSSSLRIGHPRLVVNDVTLFSFIQTKDSLIPSEEKSCDIAEKSWYLWKKASQSVKKSCCFCENRLQFVRKSSNNV